MIRGFILQLQFLTRFPVPITVPFNELDFAKGVPTMPLVGLLIGLCMGGIYSAVNAVDNSMLAVIAALVAEIGLTGGLHLDGLADTCDGLVGYHGKQRALEIMKDPRIGTHGVLGLILVILLKIAFLLSVDAGSLWPTLVILPVLSRMTIAWSAGLSPYARSDGGSARSVVECTGWWEITVSTMLAMAILYPFVHNATFVFIPTAILFCIGFTMYVKRRIGGITGDTIGALVELSEIVVLLTAYVLYRCHGTVMPSQG